MFRNQIHVCEGSLRVHLRTISFDGVSLDSHCKGLCRQLRISITKTPNERSGRIPNAGLRNRQTQDQVACLHSGEAMQENRESGQGRDRTGDTRIFSPLLYQLSYLTIEGVLQCISNPTFCQFELNAFVTPWPSGYAV